MTMRLMARTNALLVALVRPRLSAEVTLGTRIPDRMPTPFVLLRRAGGAYIDGRGLDAALVDVQVWATSDAHAESLAELVRAVLWEAYRSQASVPGVGSVSLVREESAPVEIPSDTEDHGVYRYQATYTVHTRP